MNHYQGTGLSEKEMEICDFFVYIPQSGPGTASLNVTVAASIVLHQFAGMYLFSCLSYYDYRQVAAVLLSHVVTITFVMVRNMSVLECYLFHIEITRNIFSKACKDQSLCFLLEWVKVCGPIVGLSNFRDSYWPLPRIRT